MPNNGGDDDLHAGSGEDLFISNSVCEGDLLDGGPNRDNANWANFGAAIGIDMSANLAGLAGAPGAPPQCGGAPFTILEAIEDTEGTSGADTMIGDAGPNQLLGRPGADTYFAADGNDSILANSGTPSDDPDPTIDCGEGFDTAQIDHPENGPDAAPVGCEAIQERDPNSFRPPDTPPNPNPPPEAPSEPPPSGEATPKEKPSRPPKQSPGSDRPSRKAPQTRIVSHPRALTWTTRRTRRVAFRFAADEPVVGFRCRLDRGRYLPCGPFRPYRVGIGRHDLRVYAIDLGGNRDRSPASFEFRVRRR